MEHERRERESFFAQFQPFFWLLAGIWTLCIAASLLWNLHQQSHHNLQMARRTAESTFENDLLYRRWSALQGGVYVPVSEHTRPSPYLHVPERDLTTTSGQALTLVNPAYMARLVQEMPGPRGSRGHVTSLKPIRPENAPDAWEAAALKAFEKGIPEVSGVEQLEDGHYLRLMRPFVTEQACLKCHASQGYREGDIRGGISVSIPLAPLQAIQRRFAADLSLAHAGLWLVGLVGIGLFRRNLSREMQARDRALTQLRDSEERYRMLNELAPDAVYLNDTEGRFVEVNVEVTRMLGFSREQLLQMRVSDIDPDYDAERVRQVFAGMAPGNLHTLESRHRRRDGSCLPVEIRLACFELRGRRMILALARDITARKTAEEDLRKFASELQAANASLEASRRAAMNLVQDAQAAREEAERASSALRQSQLDLARAQEVGQIGWWRLDVRRNVLTWSEESYRIFGVPGGTPLTYESFLNTIHPDDRQYVDTQWQAGLRGEPYDIEHRVVADGNVKWVREKAYLEFDEAGALLGGFGITQDITSRKEAEEAVRRARDELEVRVRERTADLQLAVSRLEQEISRRIQTERALRESEQRYRTLFEAAPVGIGLTTFEGEVLALNRSLATILGLNPKALTRNRIQDFCACPADQSKLFEEVRKVGRVREHELALHRADGTPFIAMVQVDQVRIDGQTILLTMVEDITRRKMGQKHLAGLTHLLELFPRTATRREYLELVVHLIAAWSDGESVGMRLVAEDNLLPFAASVGLSSEFVAREEALSMAAGPCPCLRILRGQPQESDRPFVSERGSFFCSRASTCPAFAECGSNAPCLLEGYESMVHVPIRYRGRLQGTIHLLDRRAARFPQETVRFVEAAASLISEALERFGIAEALADSEQRFRSLFEGHEAMMLLITPETGALVDANAAAAEFYGYSREQLRAMKLEDLSPDQHRQTSRSAQSRHGLLTGPMVVPHRLASGETRVLEVHSSPIQLEGRKLWFSILHDITERKLLEQQVLEISEQERQRVGQDLHDSLGGKLAGAALMGKALAHTLADASRPEVELAEEIVRCINDSIVQCRSIAHGLCPAELSVLGLVNALASFAAETRRHFGVACRFTHDPGMEIPDTLAALHLFRIVQEAVNNAARHGRPRKIAIRLFTTADDLCLEISDDGAGLPANLNAATGLGLRTMSYRAGMLGGQLTVKRGDPKGTVVACRVPLSCLIVKKAK